MYSIRVKEIASGGYSRCACHPPVFSSPVYGHALLHRLCCCSDILQESGNDTGGNSTKTELLSENTGSGRGSCSCSTGTASTRASGGG